MIDELRSTAQGAAILADWLGNGAVPVASSLAEARAAICVRCPLNREPGWWDRVKTAVAEGVRERISVKQRLGLHVTAEDKLGICKVCGCVNPLSVWCPIEHIKSHTSTDQLEKFPSFCWKKSEIESPSHG